MVFCYPSELQLKLYHQLLRCQLIRSCLSGSLSGSPHLICIGALKQLCNHPALIYHKAKKSEAASAENDETVGEKGLYTIFDLTFCMLGNFSCVCCHLLTFFQIDFFSKIIPGTLSDCQTVWI